MNRTAIALVGLVLAFSAAACGDGDKPTAESSSKPASSSAPAKSAAAKPSASASAAAPATSAAPAASGSAGAADPNACDPKDKWTPKPGKATFEWSEKPALDKAPKDGVYASVGGEVFQIEQVSLSVDEKKKEWTLEAKAGPLGPALMMKGEPKAGATVDEKFATNRGYFQVPQKGETAECFKQTTSYNGDNARVIKLTKYDAKAKTADGSFVTTWQWKDGDKVRKFWAAGTFKDAKVTLW
jgi:hypothetical protein